MLGGGRTVAKRFIFTLIKKSDIIPETLQEIFKNFAWSMNALLTGIMPAMNQHSREIIGGGVDFIAGGV